MTRFPINFLLYLTSGVLGLLCAWTFYLTMTRDPGKTQQEVWRQSDELREKGAAETPDDRRDNYSESTVPWWESLKNANFIGRPPPEAKGPEVVLEEKPTTPTDFKVESILDVILIAYASTGDSKCAVRYKPEANVHPPEKTAPGATPGWSGPQDVQRVIQARAAQNRGARKVNQAESPTPMPTAGSVDDNVQILTIGESLWAPYERVSLVRVDESGEAVYFAMTEDGAASGEEEKLFRNELGLAQSVLEALSGGQPGSGEPRQPKSTDPIPTQTTGDWIDVEETRAVEPGRWHISRKDDTFLRENAQEVFNKDVALRNYVSEGGTVRGVQITRVAPRLARFGVQAGDVILELNGIPVSSKAQALKVGKEQHKQGVRTFRAKIMSRWGKVEERTYHAPDS